MKVLNIIHAQNMGGVDAVFRYYNEALISKGNNLAIVISDNGHDNYSLPSDKIYKLKNISQIFDMFHLWWIIKKFKPDVIICHSSRVMKWMKILRPFMKAKTVAVNHGITYRRSLFCDYVFSINQQIRNLVIKSGKKPDQSIFMPNMIHIDQDSNFIARQFANPLRIGIFGRIELRKGFDILIKAGKVLRKKHCSFKLIIGGFSISDASYNEDSLKKMVADYDLIDCVEFIGTVIDKKEFFSNIDIFCVPSIEEPFGMVIIESFLHSVPVISSDTDGGKILIDDGKNGLLFSIGDYEQLAEKIIFLSEKQNFAQILAKNAFEKVVSEYSVEVASKRLQAALENICK